MKYNQGVDLVTEIRKNKWRCGVTNLVEDHLSTVTYLLTYLLMRVSFPR